MLLFNNAIYVCLVALLAQGKEDLEVPGKNI